MTSSNDQTATTGADQALNAQEENKLIAQRRDKLHAIQAKRNAFPNDFRRDTLASEIHAEFADTSREDLEKLARQVKVAGRLVRQRGPFSVIQDVSDALQLYVNHKALSPEQMEEIKGLDLGDIVGIEGEVFRTGKGELTVNVKSLQLLTKALRPLPDKWKGLSDTEVRYRQRYVDLIANEESRRTFMLRSQLVNSMRDYFHRHRFMEVETPMMQVIPGGATAKPFVTHHNALDQAMYLRIAPELYLKRLVVGGFERVFEINRNFRNEGLSTRHNPEFTMVEFYQAYADYHDLMDFTEDMFRTIAMEVLGTTRLTYQGLEIDFAEPFTRLPVKDSILQYCPEVKPEQLETREAAAALAQSYGIKPEAGWGVGRIVMEIFDEKVEHHLLQPTFITEYPTEVSPLARRNDHNPEVTDRFELIIGGRELANGFSELNDAEDQALRFREQVDQKDAGDDEAMHYDADYITALEYGMPPTAGEGIGIDRLVMLFTDAPSIKDVLLFPHMRPLKES
ncbi:lysine--tRNA ligase [Pseudohongiella sp.]|uniref:lysine--tRNA ligase n=1 Tax=marine sediment metagenome TaxID=412755 RepID=A0A0F9W333_9ZZZZ|nr:lysine--tRNA ligase [Pseudohongiella sp.]HDZ09099.1 lysine--tRNA ligase [Pseudohongiella sp.]HEA63565.1 lysine--tRNA ligase [Pseudohongiella sp.]